MSDEIIQEEQAVDESVEKAKAQGWTDKDSWQGDPDRWVDAETFLKRGNEINGILKDRNEKLFQDLQALRKDVLEIKDVHMRSIHEARQQGYEKALRDLKARQREAVRSGDEQAFEVIEQDMDKIKSAIAKDKEQATPSTPPPTPEFTEWLKGNGWYGTDPDLTDFAEAAALKITNTRPGLTQAEMLNLVTERVKSAFPHKFTNPRRNAAADVEGAQNRGVKKGKKGYDDLPAEAKRACDRFVGQKLMTKEQYIADFFEGV
jgi:hypothetical protein